MKKLIVNADDFGISELTNKGIIYCFTNGILTSTTIMANGIAFEGAVELAKKHKGLGIGVHLNLTQGKPLTDAFQGELTEKNIYKAMAGLLDAKSIKKEFRTQIEKVLDNGIKPTHLDGHKHIHIFPKIAGIVISLAKEYDIKAIRLPRNRIFNYKLALTKQMPKLALIELYARKAEREIRKNGIKTTEEFYGVLETGQLTKEHLAKILLNMGDCTAELMCHPGYYDKDIPCVLKRQREIELKSVTHEDIKQIIAEKRIKLINYRNI